MSRKLMLAFCFISSAVSCSSEELTPELRIRMAACETLMQRAQQSTANEQAMAAHLNSLIERSELLVQKLPDTLRVWQLRAVAAVELKNDEVGCAAAKNLKRLGAMTDPKYTKLMADLDIKGWLNENFLEAKAKRYKIAAWILNTYDQNVEYKIRWREWDDSYTEWSDTIVLKAKLTKYSDGQVPSRLGAKALMIRFSNSRVTKEYVVPTMTLDANENAADATFTPLSTHRFKKADFGGFDLYHD